MSYTLIEYRHTLDCSFRQCVI